MMQYDNSITRPAPPTRPPMTPPTTAPALLHLSADAHTPFTRQVHDDCAAAGTSSSATTHTTKLSTAPARARPASRAILRGYVFCCCLCGVEGVSVGGAARCGTQVATQRGNCTVPSPGATALISPACVCCLHPPGGVTHASDAGPGPASPPSRPPSHAVVAVSDSPPPLPHNTTQEGQDTVQNIAVKTQLNNSSRPSFHTSSDIC